MACRCIDATVSFCRQTAQIAMATPVPVPGHPIRHIGTFLTRFRDGGGMSGAGAVSSSGFGSASGDGDGLGISPARRQ